jgi:hypothetical protein
MGGKLSTVDHPFDCHVRILLHLFIPLPVSIFSTQAG